MERIAALSTGTKLMLASATLLFFDLFLTWQKLPQRFGGKFEVTDNLDAWDGWGLLLGLLALSLLTLLILRETDVELSPEVPWNRITLGITGAMLVIALLKNLTDAHSAWASYAGIGFAALAVVGAYLDRNRIQPERERPLAEEWKPRVRASPGPAPSGRAPEHRATGAESETQAAEPSSRW